MMISGFIYPKFPDAPCMEYLYTYMWVNFSVGKYTSTMEHLGIEILEYDDLCKLRYFTNLNSSAIKRDDSPY